MSNSAGAVSGFQTEAIKQDTQQTWHFLVKIDVPQAVLKKLWAPSSFSAPKPMPATIGGAVNSTNGKHVGSDGLT